MHEQRLIRRKLACFNALVEYRVMMRPVKERLQSAIHTFLARVNTQLVKAVFRSWHDEAFGPRTYASLITTRAFIQIQCDHRF